MVAALGRIDGISAANSWRVDFRWRGQGAGECSRFRGIKASAKFAGLVGVYAVKTLAASGAAGLDEPSEAGTGTGQGNSSRNRPGPTIAPRGSRPSDEKGHNSE